MFPARVKEENNAWKVGEELLSRSLEFWMGWLGKASQRRKQWKKDPKGIEKASHIDSKRKSMPGRGSNKCKGLGVATWLACSRNSKASGAGAE